MYFSFINIKKKTIKAPYVAELETSNTHAFFPLQVHYSDFFCFNSRIDIVVLTKTFVRHKYFVNLIMILNYSFLLFSSARWAVFPWHFTYSKESRQNDVLIVPGGGWCYHFGFSVIFVITWKLKRGTSPGDPLTSFYGFPNGTHNSRENFVPSRVLAITINGTVCRQIVPLLPTRVTAMTTQNFLAKIWFRTSKISNGTSGHVFTFETRMEFWIMII